MRRYLAAPPARFAKAPALPLLVWISISGTFPIHLFVPVLPQAAHDLNVTPAAVQSAITAYLVGLSLGQLILGPVSDRLGRRPVLVAGLFVYVVGTLGVAFSTGLAALICARGVQAIGGCAGLVLGRAITRDTAGPQEATRRMAILAAAMSLGPGLAPIVGAHVALLVGWRGMFLALAAVSAALFILTAMTLPETHISRRSSHWHTYVRSWGQLLANARFRRFCVGGAFATTSFYAFVANAPFILHERFGFDTGSIGSLYLLVVGSLTVGSLAASRVAGRVSSHAIVVGTSVCMCLAAGTTIVMEITDTIEIVGYLASIMVLTGSIGLCSPFAISEAVNVDPAAIGAASGLYGCLQMGTGAIIVLAVGLVPATPIMATGIVLLAASVIAFVSFVIPVKNTV